jgi:DNA-binding MarR family transcriptional regulator
MSSRDSEAVAGAIDHLVMWARRQTPTPVSTTTITTLDTLLAEGPLRVSQLAEREAISQPGMTTLIDRLEAAGQAERIADPSDGRATLVRITEVGRKVLAARQADRTAALVAELERLEVADKQALLRALPAVQRLIGRQKGSGR